MTRREVFSEEKAGLFIYVRGKYSSQELYCPFIAVIGMVLCCMNLDPTKDKKGGFLRQEGRFFQKRMQGCLFMLGVNTVHKNYIVPSLR